jgi:hypothetical protein
VTSTTHLPHRICGLPDTQSPGSYYSHTRWHVPTSGAEHEDEHEHKPIRSCEERSAPLLTILAGIGVVDGALQILTLTVGSLAVFTATAAFCPFYRLLRSHPRP